jgi:cell division protein FtsB
MDTDGSGVSVVTVVIPAILAGFGFMAWWIKKLYGDLEACRKTVDECNANRLKDAKEYEAEIRGLMEQFMVGDSHDEG